VVFLPAVWRFLFRKARCETPLNSALGGWDEYSRSW
jgi:hypothetical protein